MATATLYTELTWDWQDWRGRDREADLCVTYTCDADFSVQLKDVQGELPDDQWEALEEWIAECRAPDAYAEWLAENADWQVAA